jgi:hypothetical protein
MIIISAIAPEPLAVKQRQGNKPMNNPSIIETPRIILQNLNIDNATDFHNFNLEQDVLKLTESKPFVVLESAKDFAKYKKYEKYEVKPTSKPFWP